MSEEAVLEGLACCSAQYTFGVVCVHKGLFMSVYQNVHVPASTRPIVGII